MDENLPTSQPAFTSAPSPSVGDAETNPVDANHWRARLDPWLDRSSEWLNPILVKESRQAFKSRQFMVTFFPAAGLLLDLVTPRGRHTQPGNLLRTGRFDVAGGLLCDLIFPLTVIIPFSAFRSLAAERDDGTYELLSISTLRPRQIITGKMSSSMLQMIIYLSVLAPCMTFTYLLRGIDIAMIVIVVFYSALTCWFLSALGLMLATLTGPRHWQVFASVFFILLLALVWFGLCSFGVGVISQAPAADLADSEFWFGNAMIISGLAHGESCFSLPEPPASRRAVRTARRLCASGWWLVSCCFSCGSCMR